MFRGIDRKPKELVLKNVGFVKNRQDTKNDSKNRNNCLTKKVYCD